MAHFEQMMANVAAGLRERARRQMDESYKFDLHSGMCMRAWALAMEGVADEIEAALEKREYGA
jgi:hypothetical protein